MPFYKQTNQQQHTGVHSYLALLSSPIKHAADGRKLIFGIIYILNYVTFCIGMCIFNVATQKIFVGYDMCTWLHASNDDNSDDDDD